MTPLQELIAKYEKSIKRLDQRIISSRAHPSRTAHLESVMETYEEVVSDLGKLVPEEAMIKALHAQIAKTQRLYQTILNIEYRGKASGVELYDCVADEAVAVLDKLHASMEKPKEYQP